MIEKQILMSLQMYIKKKVESKLYLKTSHVCGDFSNALGGRNCNNLLGGHLRTQTWHFSPLPSQQTDTPNPNYMGNKRFRGLYTLNTRFTDRMTLRLATVGRIKNHMPVAFKFN